MSNIFILKVVESEKGQIHFVHTPNDQRIIGIKTTQLSQIALQHPTLTFTAFCYVEGWVYLGADKPDCISVKDNKTIVMTDGKEYEVLSAFAKLTNDRREDPECVVTVNCKIELQQF